MAENTLIDDKTEHIPDNIDRFVNLEMLYAGEEKKNKEKKNKKQKNKKNTATDIRL
jgi:hypothetical protein